MKLFVVFSSLLVAVAAHTSLIRDSRFVPIIRHQHDISDNGVYSLHSESADSIHTESGALVLPSGSLEHGATKTGSFSYTSPEGKLISTSYIADENGFRAVGDHLPVPPPMPEEIRSMLPTLPKLVETHEVRSPVVFERRVPVLHRPTFVREEFAAPALVEEHRPLTIVRNDAHHVLIDNTHEQRFLSARAPAVVRAVLPERHFESHFAHPALVEELVPQRNFVQTSDFLMHSSPAKTIVRIGN